MSTEVQQAKTGNVLVFGCPTATLNNSGTTSLGVLLSDVTIAKTAESMKIKNEAGETVNITTFNQNITATCSVTPVADTRANATTKLLLMPSPGDEVLAVSSGSPSTWTDTDFSATSTGKSWRVVSATRKASTGNAVVYDLVLEREGAITSYAQV